MINNIKEDSIFLLYRRGKAEHIRSLYEFGEIYINTIEYIRECDNNNDRSDPTDGIVTREYFGDVDIKICDVGLDIDKDGVSVSGFDFTINADTAQKGNIYCMSAIYGEHLLGNREMLEFDIRTFGESLIVIHNPKEFIKRVLKALNDKRFEKVKYNRVSYYSNEYSGEVGFFKKHVRFKPQNEFRFYVPNSNNAAIKLQIGSIADIAMVRGGAVLNFCYTDGVEQIIKIL